MALLTAVHLTSISVEERARQLVMFFGVAGIVSTSAEKSDQSLYKFGLYALHCTLYLAPAEIFHEHDADRFTTFAQFVANALDELFLTTLNIIDVGLLFGSSDKFSQDAVSLNLFIVTVGAEGLSGSVCLFNTYVLSDDHLEFQ